MGSRAAVLAVVLCVVLAGCTAVPPGELFPFGEDEDDDPSALDPDRPLGEVRGVSYDDDLGVNSTAELSEAEREAVVHRAMARVEVIRGLQFEEEVPVEVISREGFREERRFTEQWDEDYATWNDHLWRALFHVDEETAAAEEFEALYGGAVQGYYSSGDEEIVIVADDPDAVAIDRNTLAHELLHALQDQHFGLERDRSSLDSEHAALGIIEGDANYVELQYDERCEDGEWECLDRPSATGSEGSFDFGLLVTIFQPYSDGPAFVDHRYGEGGWEAVNEVYDAHPSATTEVIHPDRYGEFEPTNVTVRDESTDDWERFNVSGREEGVETVGEAALYASFWSNGVIDREHLYGGEDPLSPYDYSHPITTGWAGDQLVPYEGEEGEYAFVFESEWESEGDAERFAEAYGELLAVNGADEEGEASVIEPGESFAGAYHVSQDGETVTVVHAPSESELEEVHGVEVGVPASLDRSEAVGPHLGMGSDGSGTAPAAG